MGKKRKNMKNSPLWSKFWGFKRKITTFPQETPSFHRGTLRKQANRKTDKRKRGAKPMVQHPEVYEKK